MLAGANPYLVTVYTYEYGKLGQWIEEAYRKTQSIS
jgi:hypothetical protein